MSVRTVHPPAGPFRAHTSVPGDKSLSHRALILAAMADGESTVTGIGSGEDVVATRDALEQLGVGFEGDRVISLGVDGWQPPDEHLDAGNSGTAMRLLAGAMAGRPFTVTIVGDESLSGRPMERIAAPLRTMGAVVETTDGHAPITVGGGKGLKGTTIELDVASAQVRTGLELAALQAVGATTIDSPPGFRSHTERWFTSLGLGEFVTETAFRVEPNPPPPTEFRIPGDTSSAAYLWAAAALSPGSVVRVGDVSINDGRMGFLKCLSTMGVEYDLIPVWESHTEPAGAVTVAGSKLRGTRIEGPETAQAIDEIPLIALLATQAKGTTVIADAEELRVKESDRISATAEMIWALGGTAEETPDGLVIDGGGPLAGGTVDPKGDHRIAMTAGVAAAASTDPVHVQDAEIVSVSWPGFFEALEATWSSP